MSRPRLYLPLVSGTGVHERAYGQAGEEGIGPGRKDNIRALENMDEVEPGQGGGLPDSHRALERLQLGVPVCRSCRFACDKASSAVFRYTGKTRRKDPSSLYYLADIACIPEINFRV